MLDVPKVVMVVRAYLVQLVKGTLYPAGPEFANNFAPDSHHGIVVGCR